MGHHGTCSQQPSRNRFLPARRHVPFRDVFRLTDESQQASDDVIQLGDVLVRECVHVRLPHVVDDRIFHVLRSQHDFLGAAPDAWLDARRRVEAQVVPKQAE